jgi:electron transport complex protein RnfD
MIFTRIINWVIPAVFLGALFVIAGIFHLADPVHYATPLFHWFAGAAMLGAFFIYTDPVGGPTTFKGRLIYASGAALLTYLIRVFGGFPDGIAFAALLMNICVPLIDIWTQPKVFGKKGGGK